MVTISCLPGSMELPLGCHVLLGGCPDWAYLPPETGSSFSSSKSVFVIGQLRLLQSSSYSRMAATLTLNLGGL